jgi:hypothetical protein
MSKHMGARRPAAAHDPRNEPLPPCVVENLYRAARPLEGTGDARTTGAVKRNGYVFDGNRPDALQSNCTSVDCPDAKV